MRESNCPAVVEAQNELASVREELEFWREQDDPCLTDRYGRPIDHRAEHIEALECEEAGLLAGISLLKEYFG